jgi:hypothetical protein
MASTSDTPAASGGVVEFRRRLDEWLVKNKERASPMDVRRARSMDWWLAAFMHRYNDDLDVAVPCFCETLKWRHDFGVNGTGCTCVLAAHV